MTRLLLVDTRVTDITTISHSLTSDTEIVSFDYYVDTLESLKTKIGQSYDSVCIAQHNYGQPTVQLLDSMSPAQLEAVEVADPSLNTWTPLIEFFLWMKNERGVQYVDLLACFLWENPEWRYAIETIRSVHQVYIRASLNITGEGGDFILESDNVDLIGVYFTAGILEYKYDFYYAPSGAKASHTAWNPPINLPGNGGTISVSKYNTLLGTMIKTDPSYNNPPSSADMLNIVNFTCNSSNGTAPSAYGALTASGQAIFFGNIRNGGDASSVASSISSGVKKIVPSKQAFSILRVDGTIASWGYSYNSPITTTVTNNIPPSSISLTGYVDVVASGNAFCGLKADGSVVMWGYVGTWVLPTASQLSNITQIKEINGGTSYSFVALRSDGDAVMWGASGVVDTTALTSNSPIVGLYPTDFTTVIVRADGTIYKGFTNTVSYTIPPGVSIVKVVPDASTNFMVLLSNNTLYRSTGTTVVLKVSDVTVNDYSTTGYISYGALVVSGNAVYGGSTSAAYSYGIKSGIDITSGVIRVVSAGGSMAALKSNGTVAAWGTLNGGSNSVSAVQPLLTNVVQLTAVNGGYIAITSDNRIINWGDSSNKWTGSSVTPSVSTTTFAAGNTIAVYNALTTPVLVEMPISTQITPSTIQQYTTTSITYTTNVQYRFALAGHIYGLYNGSTQLSTFQSLVDTSTYEFNNIAIPISGYIMASIQDITDVVYTIDSSVNLYVTPNSVIPVPNPPSILKISGGHQSIDLVISPPIGLPASTYKYSLDGGNNFLTLPAQTMVTDISYSTGTSIHTNTSWGTGYFINGTGNIMYWWTGYGISGYSTYNGTSWSALTSIPGAFSFSSVLIYPRCVDMNIECNRLVCVAYATGSKCFYIKNDFKTAIQIQDDVGGRDYSALCMSRDGNTIAAIANSVLYYTTWIDACQNYGVFSVANTDSTGGSAGSGTSGVALSPDGKILAYTAGIDGKTIKYAIWNGSGYDAGIEISVLSTTTTALRFSNDGLVLYYTKSGLTYASYWNGTTYAPFTTLSFVLYGTNHLIMDSSYNIYVTNAGMYKYTATSVTTSSTKTPNIFSIKSGLTLGDSYTVQLESVNAGGTSVPAIASTAVIPYGTPEPPTIHTITAGNTQFSFTYTAGASNGADITNYYYSLDASSYVSMGSTSGSYTITGLTNGTAYTLRLKCSNKGGYSTIVTSASSVTPATVPGIPTISATPGTNQMSVTFTAPASNGSAITGYNYTTDGSNYTFTTNKTSPLVITGLNNGVTYTVKLQAVNAMGSSAASATATVVMPASIPSPPVITSVTPGNAKVTVQFTAPANGGSAITKYYYSDNSGAYVSTGSTSTTFDVSGLINGTSHVYKLIAQNSSGNSVASPVSVAAIPYTVPASPIVRNIVVGNGQLSVEYNAPMDNGGSSITNYYYSVDNGASYTYVNHTTNPFTITGLINGTAYSVQMMATNLAGNSVASAASGYYTPAAIPNTPSISSAIAGNQQITIYFALPYNGGLSITDMQYQINDGSFVSMGASVTSYVIGGLTNGTAYSIAIRAINAAGPSSNSVSVSATPYTVPDAPTITSSSVGTQQLSVTFSAPAWNGGMAITGYKYSLDGGSTFVACTSPSFTVYTLTNGQSYTVQVYAMNAAGTSAASNSVSLTPFAVPDAPTILSVTPGDRQITVDISNGDLKGLSANAYKYSLNGGLPTAWFSQSYTPYVIVGLQNGTPYTVQVSVVTNIGESVLSASSETIVPFAIQGTPIITTVTEGNSSATIHFIDGNANGTTLQGYQYSLDGGINFNDGLVQASNSQIVIPNLTNGNAYTVCMRSVSNKGNSYLSNESDTFVPYTAPNTPVITNVTPYNESIQVTFTQGSLGGSELVGYKYKRSDILGEFWASESPFTISGLTNGESYTVQLKSVTKWSESTYSVVSQAVVPYASGTLIPHAPHIDSVVPSNASAMVYFTDGSNNGPSIQGYYYSINTLNGSSPYILSAQSTSPLTITDLSNNVPYVVSVKAYNAVGLSAASNESPIFVPFTHPNAPTITSVTDGSGCATVHVENGRLNGSELVGYSYSLDGTQWTDVSTTANSFIVTDLVNGTTYHVYVKTISTAGYSAVSPISEPFVPSTVPTAPVITDVIAGDSRITIYFNQESNNGAEITSYIYALNSGSGYTRYFTALPLSSPIIMYELINATSYRFRLRAVNAAGSSDYSEWFTSMTPYTSPDAPVITKCYPANNGALVYFAEINTYGSPVTKFQYSIGGVYRDVSGVTSPLNIPGLQNRLPCTITIIAYNAAGASRPSNGISVIPGTPQPPVITDVVPGPKSLIVYFNQVAPVDPVTSIWYNVVGTSTVFQKLTGTSSPITIPYLVNGTPYTIQLQSTNIHGRSQISNAFGPVIPCQPPNPLTFRVTPGLEKATITLGTVVTNGSPIIGYKYSLSIDSYSVLYDVSGITNPLTIYNLPSNAPIRVIMYAVNSAGMSPPSVQSPAFTCAFLPPPAISLVNITAGLGKLYFAFKAPATSSTTPILTYLYILNDNVSDYTQYINANTTSTTFIVSGLPNNINYTARVIAVNAAGMSPPSPIMTKTVRYDYDVPTAPTIIGVTMSNESALVRFIAPTKFNNSPLVKYQYALDGSTTLVDISGVGSPATITGIPNNVSHTIQLAAVNEVGTSALSVASKPFIYIYTAPGAPTIGTITTVTGGSATMMVTDFFANGSPITNYAYNLNGSAFTTVGTTMPVQISGLTPGLSYTVRVVAINALGTSPTATKTFLAK